MKNFLAVLFLLVALAVTGQNQYFGQFSGSGSGLSNLVLSAQNQSNFQASIPVEYFGAIGDGVTDDTASIQSALNATAGKTTAVRFLSTNGYRCLGSLYTQYGNTLIGRFRNQEKNVDTQIPTFMFYGTNGLVITNGQIDIINCKLWGNSNVSNALGQNYCGIIISNISTGSAVGTIHLDNCSVSRFGGAGMYFTNADNTTVVDSTFTDCGISVITGGFTSSIDFYRCQFGNTVSGTLTNNIGYLLNTNCFVLTSASGGVAVRSADFGNTRGSVIIADGGVETFDNCNIEQGSSSTSPIIVVGTTSSTRLGLNSCNMANVGQTLCTISNGAYGFVQLFNTTLFNSASNGPPIIEGQSYTFFSPFAVPKVIPGSQRVTISNASDHVVYTTDDIGTLNIMVPIMNPDLQTGWSSTSFSGPLSFQATRYVSGTVGSPAGPQMIANLPFTYGTHSIISSLYFVGGANTTYTSGLQMEYDENGVPINSPSFNLPVSNNALTVFTCTNATSVFTTNNMVRSLRMRLSGITNTLYLVGWQVKEVY